MRAEPVVSGGSYMSNKKKEHDPLVVLKLDIVLPYKMKNLLMLLQWALCWSQCGRDKQKNMVKRKL